VSQSLVFVFVLTVLEDLVHLPFNLYETFVIEEKHGMNKMVKREEKKKKHDDEEKMMLA
jgi:hypothetical protein